jgi:dipeptidyl aminopeptidase/acylaminoacyl peptidase
MLARSPLYRSDQIQKPLLVIQGDRDVRVRPEQSSEVVKRIQAQHKPVEYWLVPQAGHGPQRLQQFRMTEDFLAACLGGRSGGFDLYQLGSWMF